MPKLVYVVTVQQARSASCSVFEVAISMKNKGHCTPIASIDGLTSLSMFLLPTSIR